MLLYFCSYQNKRRFILKHTLHILKLILLSPQFNRKNYDMLLTPDYNNSINTRAMLIFNRKIIKLLIFNHSQKKFVTQRHICGTVADNTNRVLIIFFFFFFFFFFWYKVLKKIKKKFEKILNFRARLYQMTNKHI
jgi:hypothetical protein